MILFFCRYRKKSFATFVLLSKSGQKVKKLL